MANSVKENTTVAVMVESPEGTYVPPAAGTDFVQTLSDGFEMSPTKELLERNIFNGSLGKTTPLTGTRTVSGSIPVEARAHSTEGSAPEADALFRSAFGSRRQITDEVTTKASGNTSTILQIQDADIADFAVGDIVMVKESGAYHVSPIVAVDATASTANITLLIAHPDGAMSNSVVIAKATIYTVAENGHPSLSISKYVEGAVLERAVGCRVNSVALEGFATGQLPSFNFGFEGLDFNYSVTAQPVAEAYNSGRPPIVLDARAYMDTTELVVNELTFNMENSLGFATAINQANGRSSGRAVSRTISGTFNPYKQDNSVANYTKFVNNTEFSIFAYAQIPSSTTGQFSGVVAVYMPNCIITELGEADQDGILQETITFSASRGSAGTENEIYLAFI